MPGLFGIISSDKGQLIKFSELCQTYSPFNYRTVQNSCFCIGSHAFQGKAITESAEYVIAVDGEHSIYQHLKKNPRELFSIGDSTLVPSDKCKGNICVIDKFNGDIYLASDILGSFPLYYSINKNSFTFSNLIKPLANYSNAAHDDAGIMEFILDGNKINNRTFFKGVRRLRAGESLHIKTNTLKLTSSNYSKLWTEYPANASTSDVVEQASHLLMNSFDQNLNTLLMMSAGWDSRTLLAAGLASGNTSHFKAYTHGDTSSREIKIVEKICKASNIDLIKQPITSAIFDPETLQFDLSLTENVLFPHWHNAGEVIKDLDINQITAGVLGEAFGGHYGPPWLLHGKDKIVCLGRYLLNLQNFDTNKKTGMDALNEAASLLHKSSINKPWFISDDYWESHFKDTLQIYNQDIDKTLSLYRKRGIETTENYIEAYTTEQRGTQYVTSQILSCRHHTDICLPFADRNFIEFSTKLPYAAKVHNILNQATIRSIAPELLNYPMAATLLSARHKIIAQEASRAARKALESGLWKAHKISNGLMREPRMSWVNFQFMSEGNLVLDIIDMLKLPYWDKTKMKSWVENNKHSSYHPLSDMLMKLLTIDYCLSSEKPHDS